MLVCSAQDHLILRYKPKRIWLLEDGVVRPLPSDLRSDVRHGSRSFRHGFPGTRSLTSSNRARANVFGIWAKTYSFSTARIFSIRFGTGLKVSVKRFPIFAQTH